jgi:hypothetical protein
MSIHHDSQDEWNGTRGIFDCTPGLFLAKKAQGEGQVADHNENQKPKGYVALFLCGGHGINNDKWDGFGNSK